MNLAAPPDANRLVYRIRTALTGEANGLEMAKLAWLYAATVARVNSSLAAAVELTAQGRFLEALIADQRFPNLLDTAKALDLEQAEAWHLRCQSYGWAVADSIDRAAVSKFETAISELGDLKEWLYSAYRTAVRGKDDVSAFQVASLISHRFGDDANALEERQRLQSLLLKEAAVQIQTARSELIPARTPPEIAQAYLDLGLPLAQSSDEGVAQALAALAQERARIATEKTANVADGATETMQDGDEWIAYEKSYLHQDYDLTTTGLRAEIDPAARERFEAAGTSLSRPRNRFEAQITLRKAIADLTHASRNGSSARRADRLEKLRSLERQTIRICGQIPQALQGELKTAYAAARRKSMPRLVAMATVAIALAAGGALLFNSHQEQSRRRQAADEAVASLEQARLSQSAQAAAGALDQHSSAIAAADPDSQLAIEAQALSGWLSDQLALQSEYETIATEIETRLANAASLKQGEAMNQLFASANAKRETLADDLASATEKHIQSLNANWIQALDLARQQRENRIQTLQAELQTATRNASHARSREEFDRLASAADQRVQAIAALDAEGGLGSRQQELSALIESSRSALSQLSTRWSALDAERLRLRNADSIETYLTVLERLHAFDIIPAEQKTAIEQSLRLKSAFSALKRRVILPPDASSWPEGLIPSTSSQETQPLALDEAENAFLSRLGDPSAFVDIYRSSVQYFEGGSEPQSEYSICLVRPIQKVDTDALTTDVTFNFRLHGFDELGFPERQPREMQFISRPDGSFWGFFYKPSELSAESKYYQEHIEPLLAGLASNGNRLALMEQVDRLERGSELAPAFRAYWQQQLLELMSINPWKWGLAFSPAFQAKAQRMKSIADGSISPQLWLSIVEQTVPSPEFTRLFDPAQTELGLKEARALQTLYANAMQGDFALAGFVREDGSLDLAEGVTRSESFWSVNTLTGRVERVDEETDLAPFAPLLRYRFEGGGPEALLRKTEFATGLDFRQPPYRRLAPPLFN